MTADDDPPILTDAQLASSDELRWVDNYSRLLDTKFHIPGTKIRFGVDFLLGLIPVVGDAISLGMSGLLIVTMAKHGASGKLVARMLGNVILDALVGTVPFLGNLFDLFYKANYRNAQLMREYYDEGKHTGSVWPIVAGLLVVIGVLMAIAIWLVTKCVQWFLSLH